ncbi:MAG: hypothetical protein PHR47_00180 [Candidatus Pacebacteria bacterium]|nr:hypothetical protein [Candidatus Paceibacterota bacterium]
MQNKNLYIVIIILVFVIIGGGLFFFFNNNANNKTNEQQVAVPPSKTEQPTTSEKMVNCGKAEDPGCFVNRMNGCLPVTVEMTGSDKTTKIELTIFGIENDKCHFQRKINDVIDLNCYFPKGTMNMDTLDQTFGNDKGLQKVVDENCKSGW